MHEASTDRAIEKRKVVRGEAWMAGRTHKGEQSVSALLLGGLVLRALRAGPCL